MEERPDFTGINEAGDVFQPEVVGARSSGVAERWPRPTRRPRHVLSRGLLLITRYRRGTDCLVDGGSCGDGLLGVGEACDFGPPLPGDGCSATCGECGAVVDTDGDADGVSPCDGDCDDDNPTVYPGAIEIPGNTINEDCDGLTDEWPGPLATPPDPYVGTGFAIGDPMINIVGTDQYGDPYSVVAQDYGAMVLIDISAVWCGPCQAAGSNAQSLSDTINAAGIYPLRYVTVLFEDLYGDPTTQTDATSWAGTFGLNQPVLGGATVPGLAGALAAWPTFFVVDPDFVVRDAVEGYGGAAEIREAIDAAYAAWLAEQ